MKVGATGLASLLATALALFFAGVAFAGPVDSDGDGVLDPNDNCPNTFNPSQANSDADTFGDECDNCQTTTNQLQTDTNGDGCGNQCDADVTNVGVVGAGSFAAWAPDFGAVVPPASPDNDFTGPGGPGDVPPNGIVGAEDFVVMGSLFGSPPGPGMPPDTDCDGDGSP